MKLVMDGIYDYGFFKGVRLIACDIDLNEVTLQDKKGNTKTIYLDLFRKHGKFVGSSNGHPTK
jgi:hypothetical protein